MKAARRLSLLLCVLAVLLVFPGAALAGDYWPPAEGPEGFTIVGTTTDYDARILPSGRAKFHLTAGGSVNGDLEGAFHFEEWGMVDVGSGRGTNHGIMTVFAGDSEVIIRFGGQSTADAVSGRFTVLRGTGTYRDLHGRGTYAGDAGFEFSVVFTFTRSFYSHSH